MFDINDEMRGPWQQIPVLKTWISYRTGSFHKEMEVERDFQDRFSRNFEVQSHLIIINPGKFIFRSRPIY